jgi:ATP-binding cassette subfamily F protein 3
MLILDEPTNHLDVDAREALVQALNAYTGAVVLVSHDRHMLEMTADRLVLVDNGTAKEFDGTLDDYIAFVLAGDKQPEPKAKKPKGKAIDRDADKARRKRIRDLEADIANLTTDRNAIDRAMFDPKTAEPRFAKLAMSDLMKRRADLQAQIESAEAIWLEATEALETA